jgi:hypothetical protein
VSGWRVPFRRRSGTGCAVVGDGSFQISCRPRAVCFVEPPGEMERGDPFAVLSAGLSSIFVFNEGGAMAIGFAEAFSFASAAGWFVVEEVVVIKTCSGSGCVGSMWKVYCWRKGS